MQIYFHLDKIFFFGEERSPIPGERQHILHNIKKYLTNANKKPPFFKGGVRKTTTCVYMYSIEYNVFTIREI